MRGICLLATAAVVGVVGWAVFADEPKPQVKADGSPHADAITLVLRTQADVIRKVEAPGRIDGTGDELWWHDTVERTWSVKRPFAPGFFDSTHWFIVTYRIDGKIAASWMVDTRKGTATLTKREKAPPPR